MIVGLRAALAGDVARHRLGGLEPVGVDVVQRDLDVAQRGQREDVAEQVLREDDAAGADERDPRHPLFAPSVSPLTKCFWSTTKTSSVGIAVMQRSRREQVVVGEELALQVVQRRRDRALAAARDQDQRPEEVVVDEGELERRERGERRLAERQDDPEVLAHDPGAVDARGLGQRLRNRLHVVREHERAEARLEGDVDRDQPEVRVVEEAAVREPGRQRDAAGRGGTAAGGSPAAAAGSPP